MKIMQFQDDLKHMGLEECLKKHNLSLEEAFKLSDKPITRKGKRRKKHKKSPKPVARPKRRGAYKSKRGDMKHIYIVNERYSVRKRVDGVYRGFGVYDTKEEAILVKKELEKVNWDRTKLKKILEDNNIRRGNKN